MRRFLARVAAGAVVALCLWAGATLATAYALTRRPHERRTEAALANARGGEELAWTAADGVGGSAWWTDVEGTDAPVVLLLHGQGETRRAWEGVLDSFHARGVATLAATLRAHGGSGGDTCAFGWGARLDVVALVEALRSRTGTRPVVVVGRSLGAAATLFAGEDPALEGLHLVLEAPYSDLATAVRNRTSLALGEPLGGLAAWSLLRVAPWFLDEPGTLSPAAALVRRGHGRRLVLLAGGADEHTRPVELERMAASVDPPVRLELFADAAHCGCLAQDPERWWAIVDDVLGEADESRGGEPGAALPSGAR